MPGIRFLDKRTLARDEIIAHVRDRLLTARDDVVGIILFGRFRGLQGPGLFWIVPIVDRISAWIDHRVMVTPFTAERTLTKDTVPVDVDAVLFWLVWDAEKAALEVENYQAAISWAAQTACGKSLARWTWPTSWWAGRRWTPSCNGSLMPVPHRGE
jgi:hypothetical protein